MKEIKLLGALALVIVSSFLYWTSKVQIDSYIISLSTLIFLSDYLLLETANLKRGLYLSFNTIFSFSFFFASYVLALIIAQSDIISQYMGMTSSQIKYVNFNYLTKGASLSSLAYSLYTVGYLWIAGKNKPQKYHGFERDEKFQKLSNSFLWFFFILSMLNIVYSILSPREGGRVMFMDRSFIYEYFRLFLVFTLFSKRHFLISKKKSFSLFWRLYKTPLLMSVSIVLLFLLFGERGETLMIVLIILGFVYFYCYKIRLKSILLIGLVGLFFLYGMRLTRSTNSSISSGGFSSFVNVTSESVAETSPILMFSDLIGTAHELCFGLEITERKGLTHSEQFLLLPLYPIPFMPSVMSDVLLGVPLKELSPITSLNSEMMEIAGQSCFGNHIVVDIYMRWGVAGVFICFFLLGMTISYYSRNRNTDVLLASCFLILFANCLYLPRGTMLSLIREITNVYIFMYFFSKSHRKKRIIN